MFSGSSAARGIEKTRAEVLAFLQRTPVSDGVKAPFLALVRDDKQTVDAATVLTAFAGKRAEDTTAQQQKAASIRESLSALARKEEEKN